MSHLAPPPRSDAGQALVEAAIVVPLMLFVFICLLQIMLIAHARVLVDYAAFVACRAGVVYNGNYRVMRNAALVPMLPTFGRTHNVGELLLTAGKVRTISEALGAVDEGTMALERFLSDIFKINISGLLTSVNIIDVDILNPSEEHFGDAQEIDFDLPSQHDAPQNALERTRLTVQVRWLMPLRVPIADRLVFYLWAVSRYLDQPAYGDWLDPKTVAGKPLQEAVEEAYVTVPDGLGLSKGAVLAYLRDVQDFNALKLLAHHGFYMMPLYGTYSMPMESNLYRDYFRNAHE